MGNPAPLFANMVLRKKIFFGPPGIKMTFEKNLLCHHLAYFLAFLSCLNNFLLELCAGLQDPRYEFLKSRCLHLMNSRMLFFKKIDNPTYIILKRTKFPLDQFLIHPNCMKIELTRSNNVKM